MEPDTFAKRLMYDPELLTGPAVWGIFSAIVGALVGQSVDVGLGGIDGLLIGAWLGLAIAHKKKHSKPDPVQGSTIRRP